MTANHNPGHGTKADIKGRETRLGATKSPRFPTLDGRPRRPVLPFWQLWTQFGLSPPRVASRSLEAKGMEVFVGLLVDAVWNGESHLQAGVEIYYQGHLRFWLFLSSQNDPLLGPQFHPPRVVNWRPDISVPVRAPGPNYRLCTQIEVLDPASYPVNHWPCSGRATHPCE